ncbi:MAG TPA: tetratricopeptide repeat protein [Pyrinomonadaceae bacterium]|nr:tetratricopeptide repeat protein [Pyrinomonadaceae bacterium]
MRIAKSLILISLTCALTSPLAYGQNKQAHKTGSSEPITEREQDGLNGPVRRVRVETAKVSVKDGKLNEGPRTVREVTTYDLKGKRVDTVAHPVALNRPAGKEQYKYDDKGNLIEMTIRGTDGSVLGHESYEYEFDELGNWKKMTSSIGIFEDGKVSFEPIEVTYRTIAYYYSQAVEKIATASDSKASAPLTPANTFTAKIPEAGASRTSSPTPEVNKTTPGKDSNSPIGVAASSPASVKDETKEPGKNAGTAATTPSGPPPPETKKIAVKRVSEEVLRAAAVSIAQPEFPIAAELTGRQQKVEVQVVVDEKGEVTSARATSPETLLNEAAENAARKSRFIAAKLSDDPAQIFSVISFEFNPRPAPPPTTTAPVSDKVVERTVTAGPDNNAVTKTVIPPKSTASEEPVNLYDQGIAQLTAGRYEDGKEALKQFVYRHPEDARGYLKLGLAYSLLKKHQEAVAAYKMGIKIGPDLADADAYQRLGLAYNQLKKYPEALNAFKQAIYVARAQSLDADQSGNASKVSMNELRYNLGLAYYNIGRYPEAIKELKQVVATNPQLAEGYYALAVTYISVGDKRSAEMQVDKLRPINPDLAKKLSDFLVSSAVYVPPGCLVFPCNR